MDHRRRFLVQSLWQLGVAAGSASVPLVAASAPRAGGHPKRRVSSRARVVIVHGADAMGRDNRPHAGTVRKMLAQGLCRLMGKSDPRAALSTVVRPVDTVGLKVNCLAGRHMSTRVALVEALVALLSRTGLKRQQAIVFDRSESFDVFESHCGKSHVN